MTYRLIKMFALVIVTIAAASVNTLTVDDTSGSTYLQERSVGQDFLDEESVGDKPDAEPLDRSAAILAGHSLAKDYLLKLISQAQAELQLLQASERSLGEPVRQQQASEKGRFSKLVRQSLLKVSNNVVKLDRNSKELQAIYSTNNQLIKRAFQTSNPPFDFEPDKSTVEGTKKTELNWLKKVVAIVYDAKWKIVVINAHSAPARSTMECTIKVTEKKPKFKPVSSFKCIDINRPDKYISGST